MALLPSPPSLPSGSGAATGEWTRGGCIGMGSFGSVSLACDRSSGRVFAVKSVKLGSLGASPAPFPGPSAVEALENEIRVLRSLSSPYIVSYIGEETTVEPGAEVLRNLLMEFVPGGTVTGLAARCREKGGAMEETAVRSYARCVARALEYLHGAGVVHGDVKGRNVLAGTVPGEAKLADFGAARRFRGGGGDWEDVCVGAEAAAAGMDHPRGTPLWMAPEVVRGEPTSPASDVWSLGCTVIEMVTGRAPWSECAQQDAGHLLLRIALGEGLPEFPAQLSKSGRDFLDKCLRRDPAERWSCERLLRHPFLAEAAEQSPRSVFEWINFGFDSEEDEEEKSSLVASTVPDAPSANSGVALSGRVRDLVSDGEASWEDTGGWEVVRLAHPATPPCLSGGKAGEAVAVSAEDTGAETSPGFSGRVGTRWEDDGDDVSVEGDSAEIAATGRPPLSSARRPGSCYCRCTVGSCWRQRRSGGDGAASWLVGRRRGVGSPFVGVRVKSVPLFFDPFPLLGICNVTCSICSYISPINYSMRCKISGLYPYPFLIIKIREICNIS